MDQNKQEKKIDKNDLRRLQIKPAIGGRIYQEEPSGMIVLRINCNVNTNGNTKSTDTLEEFAKQCSLKGLSNILEKNNSPKSYRLVHSIELEKLMAMEQQASRTKFAPLHSLTQYWRIDLREKDRTQVKELVEVLNSLQEVESAWEEPLDSLPMVTPGDDPYNISQGYQDSAPDGVDVRWMWTQPNGAGAGVGIVDVEGGWRVTHEDLAPKAPTLIHGAQYASWEDHGTAVLGEIIAADNAVGVVGSAPAITSIRMSSIYDTFGIQHTTDALVAAVAAMSAGEIMLIELQTGYKPVETLDDRLDVIRLATALGIIVVEAAGNGYTDLDTWTTPGGLLRLNRTSTDFVDSGAIMVGASLSSVPHDRCSFSNYGSRIDCFAWGENVTSTGYGDLDDGGGDDNRAYTDSFGGTSSASPIIVSVAALVQSRYMSISGTILSPSQLRVILSNPATGTPQGGGVPGAIGIMPDLAQIVPTLGLQPDIYLRDAIGDTGTMPWTGGISLSPDVIVQPFPVADPQLAFGEGSGTENDLSLGSKVEQGQDNTIYIRVRNRGGVAAANVIATVYWSEVGTLVTPSMWNQIGTVTIPNVPIADILTVSPGLIWAKADIPAVDHYCFVVTLSHPADPAPPIPSPMDWSSFENMISAQNNITWRNFNVVEELVDPPSFKFKMVGAEDRTMKFGFEIERRLPIDAILELEGPLNILNNLRGDNHWKIIPAIRGEGARMILPALPRIQMDQIRIPKGGRLPFAIKVNPGKGKLVTGHGITIKQFNKENEIGRIQWHFEKPKRIKDEIRPKNK